VRRDAGAETRFHLRTGIASAVPWLFLPERRRRKLAKAALGLLLIRGSRGLERLVEFDR
jgi:hypothetical protein